MSIASFIRDVFLTWKDKSYISRREAILMDIENEVDIEKRFEKHTVLNIRGTLLGGMASSTAYASFKREHFDVLENDEQRDQIKSALLRVLRSSKYGLTDKMKVAYICADLVLAEAAPSIERILQQETLDSYTKNKLVESLNAIKSGRSITELYYEELKRRGDL